MDETSKEEVGRSSGVSRHTAGSGDNKEKWRSLNVTDDFSDVTFTFDDGCCLHLHRQVLAHHSPVFRTMFTADFLEKQQSEINFPEKSSSQFQEFVSCTMYPPFGNITDESVSYLLQLAEEYQVSSVSTKCEDFLLTQTPGITHLVLAERHKLARLHETAIRHAVTCPWKQLQPVIQHLGRDTLEKIVFRREGRKDGYPDSPSSPSSFSSNSQEQDDEKEKATDGASVDVGEEALFRDDDHLSDVILRTKDGKAFHVHSQILALHSLHFRHLLLNQKKLTHTPPYQIELDDVFVWTAFQRFLHFTMYTPFLPIKESNLQAALQFGADFKVQSILDKCEDCLLSRPKTIKNLLLGQKYDFTRLTKESLIYAATCQWDLLQPYLPRITRDNLLVILTARGTVSQKMESEKRKLESEVDSLYTGLRRIYKYQKEYRKHPRRHLHFINKITNICQTATRNSRYGALVPQQTDQ